MKQLRKSDLKEGEIYKQLEFDYIFLYNKNETSNSFNDGTAISTDSPRYYKRWSGNGFEKPMVEATPEEKHWLEECIKANKFVSYEEAMKTFVPEYVECIAPWNDFTIGKIYNFPRPVDDTNHIRSIIFIWEDWKNIFKPSTKEAYDAQFKEPEFVLPEIWWVRITQENLEDVTTFLGFKLYERVIDNIAGMVKHYHTGEIQKGWNNTPTTIYGSTFGDEITTEQFRKYVLKKQDENISKFINDTTVINKEGEVFKVGDVIKFANNTLKAKIIDFRWKNDKSEICAVLPNIPNGVGIDKIELCVEPKVKFMLPEKWCVKVTSDNNDFINSVRDRSCTPHTYITSKLIIPDVKNSWLCIINALYEGFVEITLEEFKQYVLKENTTVTEKPKVVFEEPKDKVLQLNQIRGKGTTIVQVQCSEGGVYKIGDKITVFDKTSPNKGKPFTIQGFRWNNAKTKLCAVTELHAPNGIGLNKIELYIEPKVESKQELSLLEQAKLKYPVGTKIISPTDKALFTIKGDIRYGFPGSFTENYIFGNDGECSLYLPHENKWAEIVDDFVLPEKWCIKDVKEVKEFFENYNHGGYTCDNNAYLHYPRIVNICYFKEIQKDYTEITLEQFKKYVLNEKV